MSLELFVREHTQKLDNLSFIRIFTGMKRCCHETWQSLLEKSKLEFESFNVFPEIVTQSIQEVNDFFKWNNTN